MLTRLLSIVGALAVALPSASAHYTMAYFNDQDTCLRPIIQYSNAPVDYANIESDQIICGPNPSQSLLYAKPPCAIRAGDPMKFYWDNNVGHPGPSTVYISRQTENPHQWSKIWQDMDGTGGIFHNSRMVNGQNFTVTLPKDLADGRWVLRVDHVGLHVAGVPGGAQFYIRCIDIEISGGGGKYPSPVTTLPGAWKQDTPGVLWQQWTGNPNPYPAFGPPVASYVSSQSAVTTWKLGDGSGGSASTTRTTAAATTTTTVATTSTTSVRTTTTTVPRTTTTSVRSTTTTTRPSTTTAAGGNNNCASKYGQCGGQGFTGPTCCQAGSTCQVSNPYYSQCI
ncbi:hypothetical protein HDV00_012005 [Rhizophlyctis rosea]|nr:hypothetical protein HDV00_012005 [Rhizophlyctis rosea]